MSKNWGRKSTSTRNKLKQAVFTAKGYKCYLCGRRASTVDHVVPDSYGGRHTVDNLEPCCKDCNSARGNRPNGDGRFGVKVIPIVTRDLGAFTDYISDECNSNNDLVLSKELLSNSIGYNDNSISIVNSLYVEGIKQSILITSQCNLFIHIDQLTSDIKTILSRLNIEYVYLDEDLQDNGLVDDW